MSKTITHSMRIAATVAVSALGTVTLASCSGGDEGEGSVSFSMTYATSSADTSPYEALAEAYEKDHDVEIELNPQPNDNYAQSLRTQLQGGNASDVIQTAPGTGQGQSVVELAEAGFLTKLGANAEALVPEGSEGLFGTDGVYGVPMDYTVVGVTYSETAGEEVGITYPGDPEELLATCSELSDGTSMFALAGAAAPNTGMMAMSISASLVYADTPDWNQRRAAGEVTFADTRGWQDTLAFIEEMNAAGCFQPGAEGSGFDAITNGLATKSAIAAFTPSSTSKELMGGPAQGQTLTAHPFPAAGDEDFVLASSNYSLSLNAKAEGASAEAAQEFLDWVAEPEQSKMFADISGSLPASGYADLDLTGTQYEPVAAALQAGNFVPLPNSQWANQAVYEALGAGVQGLLTGQSSVDDVLASMDDAWDQ